MPIELLGLTRDELRQLAGEWGESAYRGNQLYHALYAEKAADLAQVTSLPRTLRTRLERDATLQRPTIERRYLSRDGTIRYLLRLADSRSIESVWMPEPGRQTICLSTQAGCAVDCRFCATARLGLLRNLTAGEIVGQVLAVLADHLADTKPGTNIVLMGQGEPLLNYDATLRAVALLADAAGVGIPLRKITLSTSGILPGIRRLAAEPARPRLAVSLNASSDEQRTALMPINRKYPLADLLAACRDFPLRPRERMTFEYVLLGDCNDAPEDAGRVVELLKGIHTRVNLIPWNPAPDLPFRAPTPERVARFQQTLRAAGILAFIRRPRGQDVFAACGQLATLDAPATMAAEEGH